MVFNYQVSREWILLGTHEIHLILSVKEKMSQCGTSQTVVCPSDSKIIITSLIGLVPVNT